MQWIAADNCTCPQNLYCLRPLNYLKPLLCIHKSVLNFTQFLAEGVQQPKQQTSELQSVLLLFVIGVLVLQLMQLCLLMNHRPRAMSRRRTRSRHAQQAPFQNGAENIGAHRLARFPPLQQQYRQPPLIIAVRPPEQPNAEQQQQHNDRVNSGRSSVSDNDSFHSIVENEG